MKPEQLGPLIDRLAAPLELYARQWCDSPEDVVQEAFLKLADQADAPRHPDAWLFRAVRNGAINAGIARRRRQRHEAEAAAAGAWFENDTVHPSIIDQAVDPESAQEALQDLPEDQREILVAHLWGSLTFEEIAGIAGTSASSAHRIYQSALKTLRARLGVKLTCRSTRKTNPPTSH